MGIQTALDAIVEAPGIVAAMRLADDLAFEAGRDPGVRTLRVLRTAIGGDDQVAAIAAVHALAEMYDREAGGTLARLLGDHRAFIREHAAWALGAGIVRVEAIPRLVHLVVAGGFTGMLAQWTLERWAPVQPETIAVAVDTALHTTLDAGPRARLVETLGLVRDDVATGRLADIAFDADEVEAARVAAIGALGQRPGAVSLHARLEALIVADGGAVGQVARLALLDLEHVGGRPAPGAPRAGLTVAQLFLHADIDPHLTSAGAGDNGGIATLLVRLGDALTDGPGGVHRVLTLSRGSVSDSLADLVEIAAADRGHVYAGVPLLTGPVASAASWPLRVVARRGIRRVLRAAGAVDVLHLRMADVGSLAAADVAREFGIPVVFTLAPDPHSVIQSLDRAGHLTRRAFGEADLAEHYWFRARLVQAVASTAAHTVLFPRPNLAQDLRELVGVDLDAYPERHTVVAEGVDLAVVDRAREAAVSGERSTPMEALRDLVTTLAPERRGLPLIVSLGRLHRVKGMATLVSAWARSGLRARANLLVIGGDLESPSLDEREQLALIEAAVPADTRSEAGLLLAGHQANEIAAHWLAATRAGMPGLIAPCGVYVCASLKEEFGLAVLEAMASGLVVVTPDGGGPATYVSHGDTGIRTATSDPDRLAAAIEEALDLAIVDPRARARRARDMVAERFTIQRMADALSVVYTDVARAEAELMREAGTVV